jgi:histidinol-phosphatase
MTTLTDHDLLRVAADLADRESMRTWRSDDLQVEIKPDGSPVSATDKLVERLLRELLAEHRPHDRIIGEEEGETAGEMAGETAGETGSGSRCWVLDPIDGTRSYVDGRRGWGTLIALEIDGRPVAGMVSMPAVRRRWWGTLDEGAFFADEDASSPRAIVVSDQTDATTMHWSSGPIVEQLAGEELARVARFDGLGRYVPASEWTTYPALMVADGSLDMAIHFGQHWDHAALAAVVVAAGGEIDYGDPPVDGARFAATFSNGHVLRSAILR